MYECFGKFLSVFLLFFIFGIDAIGFGKESLDIRQQLMVADTGAVQIIKTRDGNRLIGRITAIREAEIDFEMENKLGQLTLKIDEISEFKEVAPSAIKDGKYWFPDPNQTRLLFAPTGRMLKQSSGYFQDVALFFPGVAFGLTDFVNLGGGMSLVPGVSLSEQLFYFTPKIGFSPSEGLDIAGGLLYLALPFGDDSDEAAGIAYGVATFGNPDQSMTVGYGKGFSGGEFRDDSEILLIGGSARVSQRVALLTENWIFLNGDVSIISAGVRFFGEKISVDFGLITPTGDSIEPIGIPYIDFVVNF